MTHRKIIGMAETARNLRGGAPRAEPVVSVAGLSRLDPVLARAPRDLDETQPAPRPRA